MILSNMNPSVCSTFTHANEIPQIFINPLATQGQDGVETPQLLYITFYHINTGAVK